MRPKVLFLLHIPPPVHGSSMVGKYICESIGVNEKFDCNYINLLASKKVSQSGSINLYKLYGFLKVLHQLFLSCFKQKPSLCYLALTVSGYAFFRDTIIVLILRFFRVQRIYHLHNKGVSRNEKKWLYRFLYKLVFKDSRVILLSDNLYVDIESFVSRSKVSICPNGIPDSFDSKIVSDKVKDNNPIPNILFLSNLIETKGVFILLRACEILKKKEINYTCSFVGGEGSISEDDFNKKLGELDLCQVKYLGKKFNEEKDLIYKEADIFAFPTFYPYECFPLVLLEAMQFSLPIISTDEGGISDVVADGINGFIVNKQDSIHLAERLEELIGDFNLRIRMGDEGRKKFQVKYTLEAFENKLIDILEESIA